MTRWATSRRATDRAFSLLELLVVMGVAILVTGLMLPAMSNMRANAERIICSSNEKQVGVGVTMYANENKDLLPRSEPLLWEQQMPQELMAAHQAGRRGVEWDGFGVLFQQHYCGDAGVFYCPSHHGEHPLERYSDQWARAPKVREPIYTNYHYAGHVEWEDTDVRRRLTSANEMVLATDGLRTVQDYNHRTGINVLHGDGSVRWREDQGRIQGLLPSDLLVDPDALDEYKNIWSVIQEQAK